jgi:hypothetical protein
MNCNIPRDTQNLGNKIGKRSSTRVQQPPGGSSSVVIGGAEPSCKQSIPPRSPQPTPATNPINWGQLKEAPKSSPAVARASAEDRLKNTPFATFTSSGKPPDPLAVPPARAVAPYAIGENSENVPPVARAGRKIVEHNQKDSERLLTWENTAPAPYPVKNDRVSGGGRTSIQLGTVEKPVFEASGRVPPGGMSSFSLRHH